MKTEIKLTAAAVAICFASVTFAQTDASKSTASPQPKPMTAPAKNQQSGTKQSTTSGEKKDGKTATPPVENKIAVSDPGMPSDKSSKKSSAPAPKTTEMKQEKKENTGVSPK